MSEETSKELETVDENNKPVELKGFSKIEVDFNEAKGLTNVVKTITSASGLKTATTTMNKLKKWKGVVEKKRVEIKAPVITLEKEIDTEAKRLQEEVIKAWTPWSEEIERYKAEVIETERAEKEKRLSAVKNVPAEMLQFVDIHSMDEATFNAFVEFNSKNTIVVEAIVEDEVAEEEVVEVEEIVEPTEDEVDEVDAESLEILKEEAKEIVEEPTKETPQPTETVVAEDLEPLPLDSDENEQFEGVLFRLKKIKLPAVIKSKTGIALRSQIDDTIEMLERLVTIED